jgi:uncharacterized membrane protein
VAHVKQTQSAFSVQRDAWSAGNAPRLTPHAIRSTQHRRRGMALVETAVVLMVLVMLTFGAVEYGWLFTMQGHVTNAARHGARRAAMPDVNLNAVQAEVNTMLTNAGLNGAVTITAAPVGEPVSVLVTAPYQRLTFLPTPATLRSRAAMVKEGP